jgi:ABC-type multidrug transport system fused ATPase/permease subunit
VQRAQVVAVLDCGVISALGTHDELLATHAPYARLFALPVPEDEAPQAIAV